MTYSSIAIFAVILFSSLLGYGQTPSTLNVPTPLNNSLTSPYTTMQEGAHEQLSLATGALSLSIPVVSLPQRGGQALNLGFVYSNETYSLKETGASFQSFTANESGTNAYLVPTQAVISLGPSAPGPWYSPVHVNLPTLTADLSFAGSDVYAYGRTPSGYQEVAGSVYSTQNWVFTDWNGNAHPFLGLRDCTLQARHTFLLPGPALATQTMESYDGSFYMLDATNASDIKITGKDGTVYNFTTYTAPPVSPNSESTQDYTHLYYYADAPTSIVDRNGNTTTINSVSGGWVIHDTVGRKINVGGQSITYTAVNGSSSQSATASVSAGPASSESASWPLQYGSGGPCSFNPPSSYYPGQPTPYVLYEGPGAATSSGGENTTIYPTQTSRVITLPNGAQYTLSFDIPGHLVEVQYPSGGYTRYDYAYGSNYSQNFSDVTCQVPETILLAKHECHSSSGSCTEAPSTTTLGGSCTAGAPSGGEATTCFNGSWNSSSDAWDDLDIADPEGNRTHYHFLPGGPVTAQLGQEFMGTYEQTRQYYSGSSTLLKTITTDYTATSTCPEFTAWLEPCSTTTTYNDASPSALSSVVTMQYDTASGAPNPTQTVEKDFSGNTIRTTVSTWEHGGI